MTSRTGQVGQSIDRIELTNPGIGYTVPPIVTIRSQNTFGTGAAVRNLSRWRAECSNYYK